MENKRQDTIAPNFEFDKFGIRLEDIQSEAAVHLNTSEKLIHAKILDRLLSQIKKIDFRERVEMKSDSEKLTKRHFLICCIDEILKLAKDNNWGICRFNDFIYVYNGAYWDLFDKSALQVFLGNAAEKMGIDKYDAKHYIFQEQLFKQFMAVSVLSKPEETRNLVLINLFNGTFEISPKEQVLRLFNRNDFLKYQLPFEYNPSALAPLFMEYLNKVQPFQELQNILSEYIAYLFIQPSTLKLEKTLLLYGSGANGKSVFFEIICSMLGEKNVSNFSLQSLTNDNGYYRAMLANKLVNYASEINGKLESSIFKQLVSGEPVEARSPFGEPFTLTNYAKLIFNCNELPKDVEQTPAYFRRFLIVPFNTSIPEAEQDRELSQKIIKNELSGVFNWVLDGLKRLLSQKKFTYSELTERELKLYQKQSDSVQLFLEDENFVSSINEVVTLKDLYTEYRLYCVQSGYRSCAMKTFSERLKKLGFSMERKNIGNIVFIERKFS